MRIWISGGYFARIPDRFVGGGGSNTFRVISTFQGPQDYTCELAQDHRLNIANTEAIKHKNRARPGNDFIFQMPNGQKEHWSYMCGGYYCGPTVLDRNPRISPCN